MEEEICFPQERKQRKPRQFFCPQSHICMVSWQGSPSHYLYLAIHDLTYHSQLFYSERKRESEVMLVAVLVVLFYVLADSTMTHGLASHYSRSLGLVSLISGPAYVFGVGPGESSGGPCFQ